jgi:hypothetical protein
MKREQKAMINKERSMFMSRSQLFLLFALLNVVIFKSAFAQTDSTSVTSDTTQAGAIEEIVLEEIFIEAVIEKPNVAILPTREMPDFKELDFMDRSFEQELKALPEKLMLFKSELETFKKTEKMKKLLVQEK